NFSGRQNIDGIYVKDAYRTADNEIRILYFQNIALRPILKFWNGATWAELSQTRVDPLMALFLRCEVEAHIGVAQLVNISNATESIFLSTAISTEKHRVKVLDVRPPPRFGAVEYHYPHKLGVCLQPIYYHADWTLFVQYFEFWLASGATKFYIYPHSASRPVKAILDFYQRKLGSNMEIIAWPDLPVSSRRRGDFHHDPNTRVFQVGIHAAINDCLLRARYQVKYVSMLDLDEILHVPNGNFIVDELESLALDYPEMGTASLQWVYAEQENENRDARFPHEIGFDSFASIKKPAKNRVFSVYTDFRKVIQRPERVILTDIHSTLLNEPLVSILADEEQKMRMNSEL
ncbi:hypothetical protein PFISCL1PPCAC_3274, partial [Pristionchus fissidentatus]